MLDGPEELYTLDAYSRLSNYFGDTEDTRLVGGSFAHYSRCGTVVRRFYNENNGILLVRTEPYLFPTQRNPLRINKQYSPKPTYAIDIDTSNFKHIDLHMQARIRDKYPAPHRIGVLSERKVNIWVDYLTKIWHDLEHLDRERNAHISAHRSRLNKLPDVKWNKDRDRGSIERNGLCYSFRYETGTIQEKVSLD